MAAGLSIVGPPDFIGVGTQRSGTTWWFELLLEHPQIRGPKSGVKEQHFFDRFCKRPLEHFDIARYHEQFPRGPGQIAGEWTPRYMHDFWTPPLISRAARDAKLLVMLRDPIERFRSGVPHRMSFESEERLELVVADAIARGRYAPQLRRLFQYLDRDRVLILQYERCQEDPESEFRRTLAFLGLDPAEHNSGFSQTRGTTQDAVKPDLPAHMVDALLATHEPEVAELAQLAPEVDVSLWPNFAYLGNGARH